MQVKGQPIQAGIELRFPGMVLAVKKDKAAQKSFKDLKYEGRGHRPRLFHQLLRQRADRAERLKPTDVSIIGVGGGAGAVAAMKKGELDALVNLDPVISKLEQDGDIVILANSRTEEGNMKLFGGNNPAAVVYMKTDFIEKIRTPCSGSSTPSTRR